MTDAVESVGVTTPDANVSPPPETVVTGNEADSSPAVKKADDDVTEKVRSRFDELTHHRRQAEREREDAKRERDHWREMALKAQPAPEVKSETKAKSLADFDYDEPRYEAYRSEQAVKVATAAARREIQEQQDLQTQARRRQAYAQRASEFEKTASDYHEVAEFAPISDDLADVVIDLESGPQLAYFLGKNPDVAHRLSGLPKHVAAVELGRIDARLTAEREKAKGNAVSKAPPPPPKIDAAGDPAVEKNPNEMTDREYAKWRRKYET